MKKVLEVLKQKWVEYLLEIIVITIGILGAFALNNWHEARQLRSEEITSLKNLQIEFQENLQAFDHILKYHKSKVESINEVLFQDLSSHSLESLDALNKDIVFSTTFNPSFSIYNSLIYSGNINLIENDTVKNRIAKFRDMVTDYQDDEMHAFNFSQDVIFKYLIADEENLMETKFGFRERTTNEKSTSNKNYLSTFSDPAFRNQLVFYILYLEIVIEEGEPLKEEQIYIIEMLDAEISRLEK